MPILYWILDSHLDSVEEKSNNSDDDNHLNHVDYDIDLAGLDEYGNYDDEEDMEYNRKCTNIVIRNYTNDINTCSIFKCYYFLFTEYSEKPGYYCETTMRDNNHQNIEISSLLEAKLRCDSLSNCAVIQNDCGTHDKYLLCPKSSAHKSSKCGTLLLIKGSFLL